MCPSLRFLVVPAAILVLAACRDDPPTAPKSQPVLATTATAAALVFRQITAGTNHTCGVTTDDRAYCWGYNHFGQLGDGTSTGPEACNGAAGPFPCSPRPALVAGGRSFRQVSAGVDHTCGVTTDNQIYCWGGNGLGQLGDGTTTGVESCTGTPCNPRPVLVRGGHAFRQVEAGSFHTFGVTTDNRAFCWGSNFYGQLGDGTTTQRLTPAAVAGGLTFKQVSASTGYDFTCGWPPTPERSAGAGISMANWVTARRSLGV